jgi:hypothetical protein
MHYCSLKGSLGLAQGIACPLLGFSGIRLERYMNKQEVVSAFETGASVLTVATVFVRERVLELPRVSLQMASSFVSAVVQYSMVLVGSAGVACQYVCGPSYRSKSRA